MLQRLCSTSTISASSIKSDNTLQDDTDPGDLGPEFDLGFISHAQCDTTVNHDVVRSMLFGGIWSRRTAKLHTYLATHLKVYSERCCAVYPPATLSLPTVANVRSGENLIWNELCIIFFSQICIKTVSKHLLVIMQPKSSTYVIITCDDSRLKWNLLSELVVFLLFLITSSQNIMTVNEYHLKS